MNRPRASSDAGERRGRSADRRMLYVYRGAAGGHELAALAVQRASGRARPGMKEVHYWDTVRPPHHDCYREKVRRELEGFGRSAGCPRSDRQSGVRGDSQDAADRDATSAGSTTPCTTREGPRALRRLHAAAQPQGSADRRQYAGLLPPRRRDLRGDGRHLRRRALRLRDARSGRAGSGPGWSMAGEEQHQPEDLRPGPGDAGWIDSAWAEERTCSVPDRLRADDRRAGEGGRRRRIFTTSSSRSSFDSRRWKRV